MVTTAAGCLNPQNQLAFEVLDVNGNRALIPAAVLVSAAGDFIDASKVDGVADSRTTSNNITAAGVVVAMPTAGFAGGSFQVTSAGSGCTITYEQSNDSTDGNDGTWKSLLVRDASSVSATSSSTSLASLVEFISSAKWVRARVSVYGSGTVTVVLTQKRFVEPLVVNALLAAGSNSIGNVNTGNGWVDSTTALAANNNVLGTARSMSLYGQFCFFSATAYADVAGTLYIDWSADNNVSWQVLNSAAVAAGQSQQLKVQIPSYAANVSLRVRFVNAGAAQTAFRLTSALSAN